MQHKSFSCRIVFSSIKWILTSICACITPALYAAPATLAIDAQLRAEHYIDAVSLSRIAKGTRVETLESEAGWVKVRVGGNVGWLRASQLSANGTAPAKPVEDGRSGSENVMAISGIRSMPRASSHADAALSDIHKQRDAKRTLSVTLRKPVLKIGKDALDFSVASSHNGYLYLIMLGSDNKSFYILFPNDLDQDNVIKAGKTLSLPRKKWEISAQGPTGTDKMLAVVTETPRNLSELGKNKVEPFLTLSTDADGRPNLQWLLDAMANPAKGTCSNDETRRDRNVAQTCPAPFASALIDIVEQ